MARDGPRRSPLRVLIGDERGRAVAARGLARWLAGVAPSRARGTVSLAIVSDRRARELNRRYRGKDYATDVLSFPAFARPEKARASARQASRGASEPNPKSRIPDPCLGDIVIARGVARRQARQVRQSDAAELRVLALHGLLHLLGYDHERDHGEMSRIERRLRRKGGLADGLIERAE
jgi:probable rRNA maturation factor